MESQLLRHAAEVFDEHGAAQAHGHVLHLVGRFLRDAAVSEDVGEVPFALRLQDALHLGDVGALVGRKVERAVGDHDIDRAVDDEGQVLGRALHQLHVACVVSELLDFLVPILFGDGKALCIRLHADDLAGGPYQLGGQIGVAPASAAQVHHRASFQQGRQRSAKFVERVLDLGGHVEQLVLRLSRQSPFGVAGARGGLGIGVLCFGDGIVVRLISSIGLAIIRPIVHDDHPFISCWHPVNIGYSLSLGKE